MSCSQVVVFSDRSALAV